MTTDSTYQALSAALDDEYKARAAYEAIITTFGPVRPFTNIIQSEQRHIDALLRLFARRGWQPPADQWTGRVPAPPTLTDALRLGVQAEIDNAAMYDRLVTMTTDADVLRVFSNLRQASQERHLKAFERGLAASGPRQSATTARTVGSFGGFGGTAGSGFGHGFGGGAGRRFCGGF